MEETNHTPPILMLAGTPFVFDIAGQQLRQEDRPTNIISFDDFQYSDDGKKIRIWFDRDAKTTVQPDLTKGLSPNVVCLEFDYGPKIDPVGAQLYGGVRNDNGYKVKEKHYAVQIPLRRTSAKSLIDEQKKRKTFGK